MSTLTTGRLTLPVGSRDHIQGPATAAVTLLEYGDYECPHCALAYPVVKALQQRFTRTLRFAYRHFPLTTVHPLAEQAAEAAEAAGAQGQFWAMHDLLFERQPAFGTSDLARYAVSIGIDIDRFLEELVKRTHAARVREDFMTGVRSGVNGTPTFFINGVRHDGAYDLSSMLSAIGWAMEQAHHR
jgi:protein-disulfide isomerase